ncbi:hypothetical protein SEA_SCOOBYDOOBYDOO_23 [Mycobacterium phage ScoobyDoobyDoo]|nr:hypothetical protein SEA_SCOOBYDOOBYDOO_23 [Mycobacterium phage ScoobyDoobyDoo]
MSTANVKVGDTLIVEPARVGRYDNRESYEVVVTKVARKYFTARRPEDLEKDPRASYRDIQFEIETGLQKPKDPNYRSYLDQAYTEQDWITERYSRSINKSLRDRHKVHGSYEGTMNLTRWTNQEKSELLALLDRVKERMND